eukprot:m.24571 g.24571  ORF g.24571 m.24571 type:complete len:727 (-) comp4171_c0_seq1:164-2344(-)
MARLQVAVLCTAWASTAIITGTAALHPATPTSSFDVAVYGATGGGCAAAIAAGRQGARVALISPYPHVGGMNTGGLQHADPGNESTVGGIAAEIFQRVEGRHPPAPPSPSPSGRQTYACLASRCVPLDFGAAGTTDPACNGTCPALADNEWLAVSKLSRFSNDNMTLTVTLPPGQTSTYLKKSEKLEKFLPPSQYRTVQAGQVIPLQRAAVSVDATYDLVAIKPSPLGRLVASTTASMHAQRHQGVHPMTSHASSGTLSAGPSAAAPPAPPTPPHLQPGAPPGWLYEAHVMEEVLEEMLAEANVTVIRNVSGIASVATAGTAIESVTLVSGETISATVWVDGSYEGDLAYAGGASMTWGRESTQQYNELGAGRQPPSITYGIDPYWPDGSVIPHVSDLPLVPVGESDARIEVYDFRLCMTDSPSHRVPIQMPVGYNASEWEFWRRLYQNGTKAPSSLKSAGLGCLGPIPNSYTDCGANKCVKCDMLGMEHATDMLNGAWDYPNATLEQRRAIREAHVKYTMGLLWFWATDPAAGPDLHAELATVGLCSDEFVAPQTIWTDPPHWPYQLYVREARRLVGDFVWTEHDPPQDKADRTVGLGAYTFDCHWVSLYANKSVPSGAVVQAEGRVNRGPDGSPQSGVLQPPFPVPYDVLLPQRSQLTNLLVPVACSSSHVRFNAIRMEPVWMVMGHSAGVAATMTVKHGGAVQDVNVTALQAMLMSQQQKLHP